VLDTLQGNSPIIMFCPLVPLYFSAVRKRTVYPPAHLSATALILFLLTLNGT